MPSWPETEKGEPKRGHPPSHQRKLDEISGVLGRGVFVRSSFGLDSEFGLLNSDSPCAALSLPLSLIAPRADEQSL
jgi:hypothetical protein